jgi:hypothetical protein
VPLRPRVQTEKWIKGCASGQYWSLKGCFLKMLIAHIRQNSLVWVLFADVLWRWFKP